MKIYGISGLGADKRVFDFLKLDCDFIPIDWIEPEKGETLEAYSKRLSESIDTTEEFGVLGVSFGGLVATEISKHLCPKLTILISSAETKYELPVFLRAFGKTGFLKMLPAKLFDPPRQIAYYLFGTRQKKLLNSILNDSDLHFAKWAVNQLLSWDNTTRLERVVKISGTRDKLIPPADKTNTILVEGGEHLMIVDRAEEVSSIINESIKSFNSIRAQD